VRGHLGNVSWVYGYYIYRIYRVDNASNVSTSQNYVTMSLRHYELNVITSQSTTSLRHYELNVTTLPCQHELYVTELCYFELCVTTSLRTIRLYKNRVLGCPPRYKGHFWGQVVWRNRTRYGGGLGCQRVDGLYGRGHRGGQGGMDYVTYLARSPTLVFKTILKVSVLLLGILDAGPVVSHKTKGSTQISRFCPMSLRCNRLDFVVESTEY